MKPEIPRIKLGLLNQRIEQENKLKGCRGGGLVKQFAN
jgi:hypothetical protein